MTFSDPAVIRRLQTRFIPVAGNTHELQIRPSPGQQWFVRMAFAPEVPGSGELRRQYRRDHTVQGFFVAGADGTNYGWRNERSPRIVARFLDASLAAYRKRAPRTVSLTGAAPHRSAVKVPNASTSVVRVFSRIRPVPAGADPRNKDVGRDHFWVLSSDVRALRAASPGDGRPFPMPPALVARLVRFHLVDNVRGEPDMWTAEDVRKADFTARRRRSANGADSFVFHGAFAQRTPNGRRGLEGRIWGEFDVPSATDKVVRFRAFGKGQAWGRSRYTPRPPRRRFPMVFALVEADDAAARTVSPQAVSSGEAYPELRIGLREYLDPST